MHRQTNAELFFTAVCVVQQTQHLDHGPLSTLSRWSCSRNCCSPFFVLESDLFSLLVCKRKAVVLHNTLISSNKASVSLRENKVFIHKRVFSYNKNFFLRTTAFVLQAKSLRKEKSSWNLPQGEQRRLSE